MASVSKLVLLVLCAYHTLVAHAGDDLGSYYMVLPAGSLKSATVNCTDHKGALLSMHLTFQWIKYNEYNTYHFQKKRILYV